MKRSEVGFAALYLIIGVVMLAAVAAAMVYHYGVVEGLETRLGTSEKENAALTKRNGQLDSENAGLQSANTSFKSEVEEQNKRLNAVIAERGAADRRYEQEKANARLTTAQLERKITDILKEKQREGEEWHQTWARQVRAYVEERKRENATGAKAAAESDVLLSHDQWVRYISEHTGIAYRVSASDGREGCAGEVPSAAAAGARVADAGSIRWSNRP
jgi:hypothetical protein